mmetsp:Transcript_5968/g.23710  ORF Transcript_5968/g.23710 Transcript_5968/m.23710 type:complete len:562 (+) Transcript_5968:426-2111(+)
MLRCSMRPIRTSSCGSGARATPDLASDRGQRGGQVAAQIGHVLDADRQPHQRIGDAQTGPHLGRDGGMRHQRGQGDQALDPAEAFGQREQLDPLQKAARTGEVGLQRDADHAAAATHLPRGQLVLRMAGQTGVEHPLDLRLLAEPGRQFGGAGVVPLETQRQGLEAAQRQEAVERAGHRADGVVQKAELLAQRRLPRLAADDGHTTDHIAVAVQELGGRVDDQVEAERQRPLGPGAGEGVVGHGQRAMLAGDAGDRGQVGEAQQRVAGGLDPDQPRVGLQGRAHRGGIAAVDIGHAQAGAVLAHPLEEAVAATVEVVAGNDVGVGRQGVQDGGHGGQARREGIGLGAVFQVGDGPLPGLTGGVVRAAVFVAGVVAGALLAVGGADRDRRHHRAGHGVGLLAGVDDPRVEGQGFGAHAATSLRRWLIRSTRVTRPWKPLSSAMTATRPRRSCSASSASGACGASVMTSALMAADTGVENAVASACRRASRSDSSSRPTRRPSASTGSCDTSAWRMRENAVFSVSAGATLTTPPLAAGRAIRSRRSPMRGRVSRPCSNIQWSL